MWQLFKLTPEEYELMLANQGGGCAICGAIKKKWHHAVDHDHKTGDIRGIICSICNQRLGWVDRYFDKVFEYLRISIT